MSLSCKICEKRRPKRQCPGVGGDICVNCCGSQREVTVDCPSSCTYLQEARQHEKTGVDLASVPNQDFRITDEAIREHEHLLLWLGNALARAMEAQRAVDADAREALEALIKTYRTLKSGLIYESRPQNPYAAGVQDALKNAIEELRQAIVKETGMNTLRDADLLTVLVFLQRMEYQQSNGRRRGRAFYDFLTNLFPRAPQTTVAV